MTKSAISNLGSVGLMIDGDDTTKPDAAFTDALNVRFDGRTITQYMGNQQELFYTTDPAGDVQKPYIISMQQVMFDGFSNGNPLLFQTGYTQDADGVKTAGIWQVNILQGGWVAVTTAEALAFDVSQPWTYYKTQINNSAIFGQLGVTPIGKQYDWTGYDTLTGWGEQTTGNDGTTSTIVERRWTCKKLVSFDNRLIMLNTTEENTGGLDVPYPTRLRWSGFAQENSFPINWDDTAGNRTPEDFASAVIDGYAGWQDLSSNFQLVEACANGGVLHVYTERETYSVTPSGNDTAPFITKQLYSDLGCLDIGCVVNAHGYNYVFTGSDIVRHDSVSWVSVADDALRDYLADLVGIHAVGMVRMVNNPELSEIWVMVYGADQAEGDYKKTIALTYNYLKKTWSKKTLPAIYDTEFVVLPPTSAPQVWDTNTTTWDAETSKWDAALTRVAQGALMGSCGLDASLYQLNASWSESRSKYSGAAYTMTRQPLQSYIERRGLEFANGGRAFVSMAVLRGKGTNDITVSVGAADNPDAGYRFESQTVNLLSNRRPTFRQDGEAHAYRIEISGQGSFPVGIDFQTRGSGQR